MHNTNVFDINFVSLDVSPIELSATIFYYLLFSWIFKSIKYHTTMGQHSCSRLQLILIWTQFCGFVSSFEFKFYKFDYLIFFIFFLSKKIVVYFIPNLFRFFFRFFRRRRRSSNGLYRYHQRIESLWMDTVRFRHVIIKIFIKYHFYKQFNTQKRKKKKTQMNSSLLLQMCSRALITKQNVRNGRSLSTNWNLSIENEQQTE